MPRTAPVVVDGRGARRARRGHPWIYADNMIESDAGPGSVKDLRSRAGGALALSAHSPRLKIALCRIAPARERIDAISWTRRLNRALERVARETAEDSRRRLRILARPGPADDHPELIELPESRYLRGLQMEAWEM